MADNTKRKRKRGYGEGALNALNRALISTPVIPWELSKKAVSMLPMMPNYEFGADTADILRKAQELGILSDQNLEPATGGQKILEDVLGTAAGGLGFGTMLRAPSMISAARNAAPNVLKTVRNQFATSATPAKELFLPSSRAGYNPALREQMRQMALYDIGAPAAVKPLSSVLEQKDYPLAAAAVDILGPIASSGTVLRGSTDARKVEGALRRARATTGAPTALRTPEGAEGLHVTVPEMMPPSGAGSQARTEDAYRKAEELRNIANTPAGARQLLENRQANREIIGQMPFENVSAEDIARGAAGRREALETAVTEAPVGQSAAAIARATADRTRQIANDLKAQLPGSGAGYAAMGDGIVDMVNRQQTLRSNSYKALGDARDAIMVNDDPLRDAQSTIRRLFSSSAMPEGTASPIMRQIKSEFESLYSAQEATNKAAQESVAKQRRALSLGSPVGDINVSQNIPQGQVNIGDLRRVYRDLNEMWGSANPTERMLIGKLKGGINDAIEQDPVFATNWKAAKEANVDYYELKDANDLLGKALKEPNLDKARTYLTDNMRTAFTDKNSGMLADKLVDLFSRHSSPDELQNLFRGALEDTISTKALKYGAQPAEVVSGMLRARGELDAVERFAKRIGIPDSELETAANNLATSALAAKPKIEALNALADNPHAFLGRAVQGDPTEVAKVRAAVSEIGTVDPKLALQIDDGIKQATAANAELKARGADLGTLATDPFMFVGRAVTGGQQDVSRVKSVLENALQTPTGPSGASRIGEDVDRARRAAEASALMEQNLALAGPEARRVSGLSDTDVANAAAIASLGVPGAQPWTFARAARLGESLAHKVAHPTLDQNVYGELLSDPNKYFGAITANPMYRERGLSKLIPQQVGAISNVYDPARKAEYEALKAPEIAEPSGWDEPTETTSAPTLEEIKEPEGWD